MTAISRRSFNGRLLSAAIALPGGEPSGDPPAALTATAPVDTRRVFQRDTTGGNPPGFTTAWGKGWGAVGIVVKPNAAASALWMRLHDADSAGAHAANPGTGKVLQPAMAVPDVTALSLGDHPVTLEIPAGLHFYYLDLALDPAMTGAIRILSPFGVGSVTTFAGQSHAAGFLSQYNYYKGQVPRIAAMVPITRSGYAFTADTGNVPPGAGKWQQPGISDSDQYTSSFGAEYLRLVVNRLGVAAGLVGYANTGSSIDQWTSTHLGGAYGFLVKSLLHIDWKFDAFIWCQGAADGRTHRAIYKKKLDVILDALTASARHPFTIMLAPTPGWSGIEPQRADDFGFVPLKQACADIERERPNAVLNNWFDAGYGTPGGGHFSMLSRVRLARQFYRLFMYKLGAANGGFDHGRGPRLTGAATRAPGSNLIRLPVQHDGGTALVGTKYMEANPTIATAMTEAAPISADLARLFCVFPAGSVDPAAKHAIQTVTLLPAEIHLTLAATPANGIALDISYGVDLDYRGTNASTGVPSIRDNLAGGDDIAYGRELQAYLDPLYVPAPVPAPATLTVARLPDVPAGGSFVVKGGAAGALPKAVEVAAGGGAYAVPKALVIKDDGSWSGLIAAPAAGRGVTLLARRAGRPGPDASTVFNAVSAAGDLPGSVQENVVARFDASRLDLMWQDTAQTIPPADLAPVRCMADAMGVPSNTLVQRNPDPRCAPYIEFRSQNGLPGLIMERSTLSLTVGRELKTAGPAAVASALAGDCTVLCVWTTGTPPFGGALWAGWQAIASPARPSIFMALNGGMQPEFSRGGSNNERSAAVDRFPGYQVLLKLVGRYSASTGLTRLQAALPARSFDVTAKSADTAAASFQGFGIGLGTNGTLHELVFLDRLLSDAEANALTSYATSKWGF